MHSQKSPGSFRRLVANFVKVIELKEKPLRRRISQIQEKMEHISVLEQQTADWKLRLEDANAVHVKDEAKMYELMKSISKAEQVFQARKEQMELIKQLQKSTEPNLVERKKAKEEELAQLGPALQEAKAALELLQVEDVRMLRELAHPPHIIRQLMDCVLLILQLPVCPIEAQIRDGRRTIRDSWPEAYHRFCTPSFSYSVLQFKLERVNEETLELLQPYLTRENLVYERVRNAYANAAPLCAWVRAIVAEHELSKSSGPLIQAISELAQKHEEMRANLRAGELALNSAQEDLENGQRALTKFVALLKENEQHAESIVQRLDQMQEAVDLTKPLMNELKLELDSLIDVQASFVHMCILTSGMLTYGSPTPFAERLILQQEIRHLSCSGEPLPDATVILHLDVARDVPCRWRNRSDSLTQNLLLLRQADRPCLVLDPEGLCVLALSEDPFCVFRRIDGTGLAEIPSDSSVSETTARVESTSVQNRHPNPTIRASRVNDQEKSDTVAMPKEPNALSIRIETTHVLVIVANTFPFTPQLTHVLERACTGCDDSLCPIPPKLYKKVVVCTSMCSTAFRARMQDHHMQVEFDLFNFEAEEWMMAETIQDQLMETDDAHARRSELLDELGHADKRQRSLKEEFLVSVIKQSDLWVNAEVLEIVCANRREHLALSARAADIRRELGVLEKRLAALFDVCADLGALFGAVRIAEGLDRACVCTSQRFQSIVGSMSEGLDPNSLAQAFREHPNMLGQIMAMAVSGLRSRDKRTAATYSALKLANRRGIISNDAMQLLLLTDSDYDKTTRNPTRDCPPWLALPLWNRLQVAAEKLGSEAFISKMYMSQAEWADWIDSPQSESDNGFPACPCKLTVVERLILIRCARPDRLHDAVMELVRPFFTLSMAGNDPRFLPAIVSE